MKKIFVMKSITEPLLLTFYEITHLSTWITCKFIVHTNLYLTYKFIHFTIHPHIPTSTYVYLHLHIFYTRIYMNYVNLYPHMYSHIHICIPTSTYVYPYTHSYPHPLLYHIYGLDNVETSSMSASKRASNYLRRLYNITLM